MTAEIAVLNCNGIALAADSAVTVGREAGKIYTSADKLFQLSDDAPVGIMVYGNASFLGVPWETIIKCYRERLGLRTFPHLMDYSRDFIRYLKTSKQMFPPESQSLDIRRVVGSYFGYVLDCFEKAIKKECEKGRNPTEAELKEMLSNLIKLELAKTKEKWPRLKAVSSGTIRTLKQKYTADIDLVRSQVFEKFPLSRATIRDLTELAFEILTRQSLVQREDRTGVVVAGFGDKEHFPRLVEMLVLGMIQGSPLYVESPQVAIDGGQQSIVVPLAQQEMVRTFMQGIDPGLQEYIETTTKKFFLAVSDIIAEEIKKPAPDSATNLTRTSRTLVDKIMSDLYSDWRRVQRERHIDPVMEMVKALPKDELGAMAESLVNLTKFKRRISREQETVGGPIDVAVITKGDGFVWMKRKHYFSPELNPRYVARIARCKGK
jgi:hypothetical protein